MSASGIVLAIVQALTFTILIRVVLSWFVMSSRNEMLHTVYRVFYQITEPLLAPLRRIVPPMGGFDLTPILAFFIIQMIGAILLQVLP
jgi:YggT family protein